MNIEKGVAQQPFFISSLKSMSSGPIFRVNPNRKQMVKVPDIVLDAEK
jgi:hypothetical protein